MRVSDVTGKVVHGWFLTRQGRQWERRSDAVSGSTECPVFGFNECHAVSYNTHKNSQDRKFTAKIQSNLKLTAKIQ